jgi:C-terminal processing protease CtpA/Prc
MKINQRPRFKEALAAVAVGSLLSVGSALAADKASPKGAAPAKPPAASDAPAKENGISPSDPKSTPPNQPSGDSENAANDASANAASKSPSASGASDESKPQPNNIDNKASDASRNSKSDKADARPDAVRRNESRAIRHQTNRPSNDQNGVRSGNTNDSTQSRRAPRNNPTNIGLAFGTGAGGPFLISSIGPNGYFANAGFQQGDQIVSGGGQKFANQGNFYTWLGSVQAGQRVPFVILRNGQQQTIYWTPSQQFVQEYAQPGPAGNQTNFLGIQLDNQVPDAAVVADVEANSPAQIAGIRPNDVIVAVNDQPVSSPDEFADVTTGIQQGAAVDLAVSRTMHVQIIPGGGQAKPSRQQNRPGAAPVVAPAPVQQSPAVAPPAPVRGLLRGR